MTSTANWNDDDDNWDDYNDNNNSHIRSDNAGIKEYIWVGDPHQVWLHWTQMWSGEDNIVLMVVMKVYVLTQCMLLMQ